MRDVSNLKLQFDKIYETLWPQVYKFIYYKVQNKQEAEELSQEVFQRVYKQVCKCSIDETKIKQYIFAAARNIVFDSWRKRDRDYKVIQLDDIVEKEVELIDENKVVESNMIVQEALNLLSGDEREIILLRIIKGYSINEVSRILGKPEGTIKSSQFRALNKLKQKLQKGGYFNE
jgi:RNA polymerase sigma-70 factor (ECF subfamily)